MPNADTEPIRITLDDLQNVRVPESPVTGPLPVTQTGVRSYGNVVEAADKAPLFSEERGSILLQGWFYLGVAGLLGAVMGWGICEPGFVDQQHGQWGNYLLYPLIVALMSLGFGIAESIVERSSRKALTRGALSLPLGVVLGFLCLVAADMVFTIGVSMCTGLGVQTNHNPAFWIARGLAWAVFGTAGGLVYGIIGQSSKKCKYGVLGGMIGAAIGGMIFDPIDILIRANSGAASRAIGFALVGLSAGAAMGLVESALKDRWLYVISGPLAGKQFILYQSRTVLGSAQNCDIYLFKDSTILPQHAVIEINGARVQIRGTGPIFVDGSPAQVQVLQSGSIVQLGRYAFRYQEKHKK